MKNKFFVTITDYKGVKSYSFDTIIKKYIIVISIIFIIAVLTLIFTAITLNKKVQEYKFYALENERLISEIDKSNKEIENRQFELENLTDKISNIEKIIGEETVNDLNGDERLDIATHTLLDRKMILQLIPNGDPIEIFTNYTSFFGERVHPVYKTRRFHYGLDYAADIGTNVLAPADGVVSFAGVHTGGFGNLVILSHNFGFETYFAHLSQVNVSVGDFVTKGSVVGRTGNTGVSTGPHLHYEVHYLGKKIDPMSFTQWNIENYKYLFEKEKGVKWQSLVEMIKLQTQIIQQKE